MQPNNLLHSKYVVVIIVVVKLVSPRVQVQEINYFPIIILICQNYKIDLNKLGNGYELGIFYNWLLYCLTCANIHAFKFHNNRNYRKRYPFSALVTLMKFNYLSSIAASKYVERGRFLHKDVMPKKTHI